MEAALGGAGSDAGVRVEEAPARFALPGANTWPALRRQLAAVPAPLPDRLAALSAAARSARDFALPPDAIVVSRAESVRVQAAGLGGAKVLGLSPVAFSDDSAHAFVYVEQHCGPACGEGTAYWLARNASGRWQVRTAATLWQG